LNKGPSRKMSKSPEYCPVIVAVYEAGKLGETFWVVVD